MDYEDIEVDTSYDPSNLHPETQEALKSFDLRKKARSLQIPTKDLDIRIRLRELGEPVTLFGEYTEDRSARLRSVLARRMQLDEGEAMDVDSEGSSDEDEEEEEDDSDKEEFYTEGGEGLLEARVALAQESLKRSQRRIDISKSIYNDIPLTRLIHIRKAVFDTLRSYAVYGSQVGDTRPLGVLRFSPDSKHLLTSGWSGHIKLWQVANESGERAFNEKPLFDVKAHDDRVGGVAWHPQATLTQDRSAVNFVTGGADGVVKVFDLNGAALRTFEGHTNRVCRVAFHPFGRLVGSTSMDVSWRLYDIESNSSEELVLQEGHTHGVYSLAFQDDGALAVSGGMDAVARVWDLRSGKSVMVLDGHQREILGVDFSPRGHQIATSSNDDTVRIWDLRALKSTYTIPAHTSSVSDVRFFKSTLKDLPSTFADSLPDATETESAAVEGLFLLTSSYDGTVKIWSADDWQYVKSFASSGNKIMSADIAPDAGYIAAAEYNRTFKLYSKDGY